MMKISFHFTPELILFNVITPNYASFLFLSSNLMRSLRFLPLCICSALSDCLFQEQCCHSGVPVLVNWSQNGTRVSFLYHLAPKELLFLLIFRVKNVNFISSLNKYSIFKPFCAKRTIFTHLICGISFYAIILQF